MRDKVNVDLAASGMVYMESLNMPALAREQPEQLREYFIEHVHYNRVQILQFPRASDPCYIEMAEQNTSSNLMVSFLIQCVLAGRLLRDK
ncbi:DNA polymerase III subunit theta [Klebsiella aerogenes]|uniref:DNA polymerase III subunit theta n=1 Tax=Klebsiella aerogenes TaxID=548 RepID=UPI00190E924D|nr:DNA polymerase III subunit theta [Klebsiella aerogenes]MBK0697119.1 DNA polymerase III subunit theta [Klebsiella aerogenes]